MTYDEAVAALSGALRFGIHPSLDGIRALTDVMGRPQDAFSSVQVTGTNGKSSVTRLTAAILSAHGVTAGAYTSPHLESYVERMELDGEPVSPDAFAAAVEASVRAAHELALMAAEALGLEEDAESLDVSPALTEFELLTGAALWLLRERGVAWACLEVGMGGTWDATSVVEPKVAVITGVGLDHTERLGETVEAIAADKARIIKSGSVAVLGPGTACVEGILRERADEVGAPVVRVAERGADVTFEVTDRPRRPGDPMRLAVSGARAAYEDLALTAPAYQAPNVAAAVAAAELALDRPLDEAALRRALARMHFPGRFEVVRDDPVVVLDGAHNPQAAGVLADAVGVLVGPAPVVVIGVLADKDAVGLARGLAPVAARFVVTQPDSPRALPAADLAPLVAEATDVPVSVSPALTDALRIAERLGPWVLVTGSLYTVGQARALLRR